MLKESKLVHYVDLPYRPPLISLEEMRPYVLLCSYWLHLNESDIDSQLLPIIITCT